MATYPISEELKAVHQALAHLCSKLETLPGWRNSLAWEAVQEAHYKLDLGLMDAYEYPDKPKDFVHWREKYSHNCPF